MKSNFVSALLLSGLVLALASSAEAGSKHGGYRNGPQAKGTVVRRGGYSYGYADSINTYGDGRSLYGGASVYRDSKLDQQTNAGPFDSGFFFNSGIGDHGGDAPYMH